MREAWTDERLDDLNAKVDRGFDRMERRFERMDERFDTLQRTMTLAVIALTTGMLAGFGGLAGLIATQL